MDKIKEGEYYFVGDEQGSFVWDAEKEVLNILKHRVDFRTAVKVFQDPGVRIFEDDRHSGEEKRFYAIGNVREGILTVRFTYRDEMIRIFGAGFWRKGRKHYEDKKK